MSDFAFMRSGCLGGSIGLSEDDALSMKAAVFVFMDDAMRLASVIQAILDHTDKEEITHYPPDHCVVLAMKYHAQRGIVVDAANFPKIEKCKENLKSMSVDSVLQHACELADLQVDIAEDDIKKMPLQAKNLLIDSLYMSAQSYSEWDPPENSIQGALKKAVIMIESMLRIEEEEEEEETNAS